MTDRDPLRVRLFGYGVPYRVKFGPEGAVQPLETGPEKEAEDLARELAAVAGLGAEEGVVEEGAWALSMPFGRCGVDGLPREYLKIFHQEEGYLDILGTEGYEAIILKDGEKVELTPGIVARVRARPRPGRRVVAAFQTEDHTPLLGNAAPFTLDGAVPDDYAERLVKCHTAFDRVKGMADSDWQGYREILDGFFQKMAAALEEDEEVSRTQKEARAQGTYDVPDQEVMFARQQGLLTAEVVARIRSREEGLFRFPGMFGGITTLFNLID
jgi:hypothetical protein